MLYNAVQPPVTAALSVLFAGRTSAFSVAEVAGTVMVVVSIWVSVWGDMVLQHAKARFQRATVAIEPPYS